VRVVDDRIEQDPRFRQRAFRGGFVREVPNGHDVPDLRGILRVKERCRAELSQEPRAIAANEGQFALRPPRSGAHFEEVAQAG
jgi:hypothetical protein